MNYSLSLLRKNINYKNMAMWKHTIFQVIMALVMAENINFITLCLEILARNSGEISSDSSLLSDGGGRTSLGCVHFMPE